MNKSHLATLVACALLPVSSAIAQNLDITIGRVGGDASRSLLGDGSGIVVGVIDSGIDATHPALQNRMLAQQNFVTSEASNNGEDVFGHGTAVASIILGGEPNRLGMAPGASYINARVLNQNNAFAADSWVVNGTGYAVAQGADVLNLSLGYSNTNQAGLSKLSLMVDYIAGELGIPVVVSAGNNGNNSPAVDPNHRPQGPGDAFNVLSVASTNRSGGYDRVTSSSSWGGTSDGRNKPDIAAPGDQVSTANSNWETASDYTTRSGTSFAAPHVAGLVAQQLDYGRDHALSTDPRVVRATILNSAEKIADRAANPWQQKSASVIGGVLTATSPLDDDSGAGQINGVALYHQYSAGEHEPGSVPGIGWDLNTIDGDGMLSYLLPEPEIGTFITATLAWNRDVQYIDHSSSGTKGVIDQFDSFISLGLANLDLHLLRDGNLVAQSISLVDSAEHIHFEVLEAGLYELRVTHLGDIDDSTTYALAWSSVVPEPAALALASVTLLLLRRRRET